MNYLIRTIVYYVRIKTLAISPRPFMKKCMRSFLIKSEYTNKVLYTLADRKQISFLATCTRLE